MESLRYRYDKTKLLIANEREKCYALENDVPATIDKMFDYLAERYGITAVLSDLMFSDPYAAMTGNLRGGQYLGLHQVGETPCHHLAFRQPGIDWQIWIEDTDRAVPRKVVITYKELPGHPQFIALLDKWNLDAKLSDSDFDTSPPADCKQIDLQPTNVTTPPPAGATGGNR